jgi:hypothetical protein
MTNPGAKVHKTGGGDRETIESGGVLTIKSGGALRGEPGALVEIQPNWKTVAGTAYALTDNDSGKTLKTTSGSAVSITVPAGLNIAPVTVYQFGAGQVTFVAGGGVTIRTPETLKLSKQYAAATLTPTDTADEFVLAGYIEAA